MTESSLDRKLKRVQREIDEAAKRRAPLTPEQFERQKHDAPKPADKPSGYCIYHRRPGPCDVCTDAGPVWGSW